LEEVGKKIGLDKSALGRIETGDTPYDQYHLQQLSEEYGVTIPDLLYTDPLRQSLPNKFGTVGFTQAQKPQQQRLHNIKRARAKHDKPAAQERKDRPAKMPIDELIDLMLSVKLPEEVDAVKMLVEALIARRKE
jgi:transcriptional regulator with XRE-family HTH domain